MLDHNNNNDAIRAFAKGGIGAAIAINSGALIASLSQADSLIALTGRSFFADAIVAWAVGVSAAAIAWVFAIVAASGFANGQKKLELWAAGAGIVAVLLSISLFLLGFFSIAQGIPSLPAQRNIPLW